MLLKRICDLLHIGLCFVIFVFQIFNLRSLLSEKSKEFSFLLYIEIFQFSHNITDQFSNLTEILRPKPSMMIRVVGALFIAEPPVDSLSPGWRR